MACSHVTAHAWMLARASQSDKPAPSARTNKFRIARHSRASVALPWQRDFWNTRLRLASAGIS